MKQSHLVTVLLVVSLVLAFTVANIQEAQAQPSNDDLSVQATPSVWTYTGSMNDARKNGFSATLLTDGRVLVSGGFNDITILSSAEVYDPIAGNWSPTGDLTTPRYDHTASLLPDGRVLVAGGNNYSNGYLSSAEIYDPATGVWTLTGNMNVARNNHTATSLSDGRILVAGGQNDGGNLADAEIYDPVTAAWSLVSPMSVARIEHSATLLQDGRLLVAGGFNNGTLGTAELYDPVADTWNPTGSLNTERHWHSATLLTDGRVLLAAGNNYNGIISGAELYDPAAGVWSPTGALNAGRILMTATLLTDGTVLVAGGWNTDGWLRNSEIFDPASGAWSITDSLNTGRETHAATLLLDGRVLAVGGYNYYYGALSSSEVYGLATVPVNDNFADAKLVVSMPYQDSLDNTIASTEAEEPLSTCASGGGTYKTTWYAYTPAEKGVLSVSTAVEFSSVVSIYKGSALNNLVEEACRNYGDPFQVNVTPGTTYYIQIGSLYDTSYGNAILDLSFAPAPPNDDFADAMLVESVPSSFPVDNSGASREAGEPNPGCTFEGVAYKTAWYAFTAVEKGSLSGYVAADFYHFVGVYSGSSLDSLTPLACTSYYDSFNVTVSPGNTYYIQVGSMYDGQYGNLTLNLSFTLSPPNDDFANALVVSGLPSSFSVNTSSATIETGEPASNCSYYGVPEKTVWYAFTAAENGLLVGYTSANFESYVSVYTGSGLDNLTPQTCSYNSTPFQVTLIPGTTYYIQIGSLYSWAFGDVTLNLSLTPPPPNDNFANAMIISGLSFSDSVDNSAASVESNEPNCFGGETNRTIWYSYTPSTNGSLTAEKYGFYYSFIAVYTGDSLESLENVACSGYGFNRVTFTAEAGKTYYFQLGGFYSWDYGSLTFNLYPTPPPNADFWSSPWDPSRYDQIEFCDNSYDPAGLGVSQSWWDFGDGTKLTATDQCVVHQYQADGSYPVWYKIQTVDGRTAEITKTVEVRTHDVAITRFNVPQSAKVGQTRTITVGIRNNNYPEYVTVYLYKSTTDGYTWVGTQSIEVPVRPANRTTDISFSYTFTNEDGKLKSINFRAVANLDNNRDALPANNEAVSLPTKVTGYVPYSTTLDNPSNKAGSATTFGLLVTSLLAGLVLFVGSPHKRLHRKG